MNTTTNTTRKIGINAKGREVMEELKRKGEEDIANFIKYLIDYINENT